MNTKKSMLNTIIAGISEIFLPIVNLLSAAGILKGILVILTSFHLLSGSGDTYLILNALGDSLFYFLPIILAVAAAKKFGTDPYLAAMIGGVLLYPAITAAFDSGGQIFFAGIPIRPVVYKSSVIPIIMAVGLLKFTEQFLNKFIPDMIRGFLTPLLCIVIVSLMTLFLFGPMGAVIGDALAVAYEFLYQVSPVISGMILGALIQIMVIFGIHWSFILISMNNVAVRKEDTILALIGPAVFAQAGAALAVFVKSKDQKFRSLCLSAALSACFGVTEPAMFGINLPLKKPMAAVCIGGGLGGAIAGWSGARAVTFAFPSLATLPIFFGESFLMYLVSCIAALVSAFALTMLFKFDTVIVTNQKESKE